MDGSSKVPSCWGFLPPTAELRYGALSGQVDVSHPEHGLHQIAVGAWRFGKSLLGVRRSDGSFGDQEQRGYMGWPLADAYVRGADLVATYKPTDGWPFSPQIYWRIHPSDAAREIASLSLVVSVQTHLLETWPHISIESELHSTELLLISSQSDNVAGARALGHGTHVLSPSTGAGCIVHRLAGADFSYAEIMPPSDFRELRLCWNPEGTCRAGWLLFADFLEKGVIWRARLQSLFLPRNNDVQLAAEYCKAIDERPLPLTT